MERKGEGPTRILCWMRATELKIVGEREREGGRDREREIERWRDGEKEREREREGGREREREGEIER